MSTTVAIIGSTGRNAKAWTNAFIASGFTVRNLVRFPDRLPTRPGHQYASLDLDDPSSFEPALNGVETLGLMSPSCPDQVKREVGLINAAKRVGVERIIKLSVIGSDFIFPVSTFSHWHADIEDVLRTSDIPHVIWRPNFFMQNLLAQKQSIEAGVYAEPIGNASISYVDIRDIAEAAVAAASGSLDDQAFDLTGGEAINGEQITAVLAEASGRSIHFDSPDLENFRSILAGSQVPTWHIDALVELYAKVQTGRAPHTSSVTTDLENVIGKRPRTFKLFALETFRMRGTNRRLASSPMSRGFWYHLLNQGLRRERDWPIGFRL